MRTGRRESTSERKYCQYQTALPPGNRTRAWYPPG